MTRFVSIPRLALALAVTTMLLGGTGCSWFRKGNKLYTQDAASRPLEVPPDLDMPRGNGAAGASAMASETQPSTATVASTTPAAMATGGFTIAGTRDAAFEQVGKALEGIEGVTIANRAQLLGVYDVTYAGSNFLVRVVGVEAGVYVSAVDPRGQPVAGEGAARLIATLKSALGGT